MWEPGGIGSLSLNFYVFPEVHEMRLASLEIELDMPSDLTAAIHK